MSARLIIHRGDSSPDRIVSLDAAPLGPLSADVSEFDIPGGIHIVGLSHGFWDAFATRITVRDGDALEFDVVDTSGRAALLEGESACLVPSGHGPSR